MHVRMHVVHAYAWLRMHFYACAYLHMHPCGFFSCFSLHLYVHRHVRFICGCMRGEAEDDEEDEERERRLEETDR